MFQCPNCGGRRVNSTYTMSVTTLYDEQGNLIDEDEENLGADDPGYCDNCGEPFDEILWNGRSKNGCD